MRESTITLMVKYHYLEAKIARAETIVLWPLRLQQQTTSNIVRQR